MRYNFFSYNTFYTILVFVKIRLMSRQIQWRTFYFVCFMIVFVYDVIFFSILCVSRRFVVLLGFFHFYKVGLLSCNSRNLSKQNTRQINYTYHVELNRLIISIFIKQLFQHFT